MKVPAECRHPSIVFLSIYILCTSRNKSLDRRNSETIIANKTHYTNAPMQYTGIFHGCKMLIFR